MINFLAENLNFSMGIFHDEIIYHEKSLNMEAAIMNTFIVLQ